MTIGPSSRNVDISTILLVCFSLLKSRYTYIHTHMYKNDISELIKDSDAKNTKRQRKYAFSRMYDNLKLSFCFI